MSRRKYPTSHIVNAPPPTKNWGSPYAGSSHRGGGDAQHVRATRDYAAYLGIAPEDLAKHDRALTDEQFDLGFELARQLPLTGSPGGWTLAQLKAWRVDAVEIVAGSRVALRVEDGLLYANG